MQRTEKEIAENLDKLPDVLKEDGYPDVQAFMATYRKAEGRRQMPKPKTHDRER